MTQAIRDKNHIATKLGVLFSDGTTLVPIGMDGSSNLMINETDSIGFTPDQIAIRDENYQHVLMGVDSTDSTKLCPVYVDAAGAILIDA